MARTTTTISNRKFSRDLPAAREIASATVAAAAAVDVEVDVDVEVSESEQTTTTTMPAGIESLSSSSRLMRYEEALRKVLANPVGNWKNSPAYYKTSKMFVIDVLQKAVNLPPKSDFERQFTQELRFDKDVVLAFCNRVDFESIYHERHLFVPACLTNDKDVMTAYCSKIRRSLQECTDELTEDRDVVLAAIRLDGLELQYANRCLQEDEELLRVACASNGSALDFCPPGEIRDKLLADRDFMFLVLKSKDGMSMWRFMPAELHNDRDLLLTAVEHGLKLLTCPLPFRNDKNFIQKAVSRRASVYLELEIVSPLLQKDEEIAQAAATSASTSQTVLHVVFEHVPALRSLRRVAVLVVDRCDGSFVSQFFSNDATQQFLADKQIMLHAVAKDPDLLQRCERDLQFDVDIVSAAITPTSAAHVLRNCSDAWLQRHPRVAVKAVHTGDLGLLWTVRSQIPQNVWETHRPLWLAWIRRGGKVLPDFEETVRNSEDLALHIAEHSWREFHKVGYSLRDNPEFMKRALAVSGRVLQFATRKIQSKVEFAVLATANNAHALTDTSPIKKQALQQHVESCLNHHHVFVTDFLRGISSKRTDECASALPLLNQGAETGLAFKQLVAAFLEIPFGESLKIYRKCLDNMKNPPPPPLDRPMPEMQIVGFPPRRRPGNVGAPVGLMMDDDFGARMMIPNIRRAQRDMRNALHLRGPRRRPNNGRGQVDGAVVVRRFFDDDDENDELAPGGGRGE